jgi:hypothetical protein
MAKKDAVAESLEFAKQMRKKSGDTMKSITPEAVKRGQERREANRAAAAAKAASAGKSKSTASDKAMKDAQKKTLGGRRGLIDRLR